MAETPLIKKPPGSVQAVLITPTINPVADLRTVYHHFMRVTIAEYAKQRGVDPANVRKAILAGRILRNADGTIDSESADQMWQENTRPKIPVKTGPRQPPPPTGATEPVPGMLYADARALTQVFEAQRRKLELDARAGELISRAAVERAASNTFRLIRDACFRLLPLLAKQLAVETDERTVHDLLEAEIRRVFEDFADGRLE